jgi:hypothetical protein
VTEQARPDDLDVLRAAPLMTGRYQTFRPELGVPVRSTVGAPTWWPHGDLLHARDATPYGIFGSGLDDDAARAAYLDRLDRHDEQLVGFLADVARRHRGQPVVVLCFEDVHAGQSCHRRWLADWFQARFGIEVPESADRRRSPPLRGVRPS